MEKRTELGPSVLSEMTQGRGPDSVFSKGLRTDKLQWPICRGGWLSFVPYWVHLAEVTGFNFLTWFRFRFPDSTCLEPDSETITSPDLRVSCSEMRTGNLWHLGWGQHSREKGAPGTKSPRPPPYTLVFGWVCNCLFCVANAVWVLWFGLTGY